MERTLDNRCPECGESLGAGAPLGVCARCVLRVMMDAGQPTGAHVAAPAAGADEPEGATFPNLEILERIGRGGMGVVYRARQVKLDRLVALKVIRPDSSGRPGFADRFAREARAMARLSHPNILTIHDFGEADGLYYLVMELVEGDDLRQRLRRGPLPPAQAVGLAIAICDALGYAHEQGVVHRDIKPENVLLDRRRGVKLADFGLAKLVQPDSPDPSLTATRHVVGTPHYMAPEQLERPREVDHRADVYSLGVLLYEMLLGELPLGRYELPSERLDLDEQLDEILNRALQRDPSRRFPDIAAMRAELTEFAGNNFEPEELGLAPAPAPGSIAPPGAAAAQPWGWAAWLLGLSWAVFPLILVAAMYGRLSVRMGVAAVAWLQGVVRSVGASARAEPVGTLVTALIVAAGVLAALVGLGLRLRSSRPGSDESDPSEAARRAVRAPAAGLMVCGVVNLCGLVVALAVGGMLVLGDAPAGDAPMKTLLVGFGCLAGAVLALPILLGGVMLRQSRGYGWGLAAAVLAMLPVAPGAVVGLPMGLWALLVLTRPEVAAGFRRASAEAGAGREDAAGIREDRGAESTAPAVALITVGAVNLLVGLVAFLVVSAMAWEHYQSLRGEGVTPLEVIATPWVFLGMKLSFGTALLSVLVIAGGLSALDGRGSRLATAGCVAAMVLPSPLIVVNLPVGIWALAALRSRRPVLATGSGIDDGPGGAGDAFVTRPVGSEARRLLQGPAMGLMAVGALHMFVGVGLGLATLRESFEPPYRAEGVGAAAVTAHPILGLGLLLAALSFALGLVVFRGGLGALGHGSPRVIRGSAMVAMLMPSPLTVVGLPVGLWALAALSRPEVAQGFAAGGRGPSAKATGARESAIAGVPSAWDRLE